MPVMLNAGRDAVERAADCGGARGDRGSRSFGDRPRSYLVRARRTGKLSGRSYGRDARPVETAGNLADERRGASAAHLAAGAGSHPVPRLRWLWNVSAF